MKNLHKHIWQSFKTKKSDSEEFGIFGGFIFIVGFIISYYLLFDSKSIEDLQLMNSSIILFSMIRLVLAYTDINHFKTYYKELISKIRAKDYDWDINLNIVFLDSIVYLMILLNFFVIVDWSYVKYGAAKIGSGVLAVLLINTYKMIKRIREERKSIKKK